MSRGAVEGRAGCIDRPVDDGRTDDLPMSRNLLRSAVIMGLCVAGLALPSLVRADVARLETGATGATGAAGSAGTTGGTGPTGSTGTTGASGSTGTTGSVNATSANLTGTVVATDGTPGWFVSVNIAPDGGGSAQHALTGLDGGFTVVVPPGKYTVSALGYNDASTATSEVSLAPGQVGTITLVTPPLSVPPGTQARASYQELAWLNQQRAEWGLPAGVSESSNWSQACAAHDAYMAVNHVMQHAEAPNAPGYSLGGNWAGTHAIIASSLGLWSATTNPWNDAPIHLNQLMNPTLRVVGLDDSHEYQCVTTFPGYQPTFNWSGSPPAGTVYTYPGNGTRGIPPAEYAGEEPEVPGQEVGVTGEAGRELFVYEAGHAFPLQLLSASLTSVHGSVDVKWVDQTNVHIGNLLAGPIIIPVKPLTPHTAYTATVTLAQSISLTSSGFQAIPQTTYQWSFTTGSGGWPGTTNPAGGKTRSPRPTLAVMRVGSRVVVRGAHFPLGTVTLRKGSARGRVLTHVKVGRTGSFSATLRLQVRGRIRVVATEGRTIASATT